MNIHIYNLFYICTGTHACMGFVPDNKLIRIRIRILRTVRHHPGTSSAKGASFLMFSVSESIMMANRKGLIADPWWRPTSTAKGSLFPAAHLTTVSH